MKSNPTILALCGVALLAGAASAGERPVSPSAGVIRVSLTANQTNAVAVPFAKSIPYEGTISAVAGPTLTLAGVSIVGSLANHAVYIPTHADPSATGGAYGRCVRITGNTADSITTEVAIAPFVGDEFQIIEQHTLSSLLGVLGTLQILGGSTNLNSDTVFVEEDGVFNGYWHRTSNGWREFSDASGTGADMGNVGINFGRGILIKRRGGSRSVTISGEAIVGKFVPETTAGVTNVINNPFALAVPLVEAGIASFTTGSNPNNGDTLFIETSGIFDGYWKKTSGGTWHTLADTAGATPITASVVLQPGKAMLVRERGAIGFSLPQPFAE